MIHSQIKHAYYLDKLDTQFQVYYGSSRKTNDSRMWLSPTHHQSPEDLEETGLWEGWLTLDTENFNAPFLINLVHFMLLRVSAHVVVPLVTMCLQVRPAFSTTAYIYIFFKR